MGLILHGTFFLFLLTLTVVFDNSLQWANFEGGPTKEQFSLVGYESHGRAAEPSRKTNSRYLYLLISYYHICKMLYSK